MASACAGLVSHHTLPASRLVRRDRVMSRPRLASIDRHAVPRNEEGTDISQERTAAARTAVMPFAGGPAVNLRRLELHYTPKYVS